METLSTNDYLCWVSGGIIWKRLCRKRLIGSLPVRLGWVQRLPKAVKVRYEKGVLKPLEPVDLEEGKEHKVIVEEDIDELIKRYRGVLGKSSAEEFR